MWEKLLLPGQIYTTGKNCTLPPAVTAGTNITSEYHPFRALAEKKSVCQSRWFSNEEDNENDGPWNDGHKFWLQTMTTIQPTFLYGVRSGVDNGVVLKYHFEHISWSANNGGRWFNIMGWCWNIILITYHDRLIMMVAELILSKIMRVADLILSKRSTSLARTPSSTPPDPVLHWYL